MLLARSQSVGKVCMRPAAAKDSSTSVRCHWSHGLLNAVASLMQPPLWQHVNLCEISEPSSENSLIRKQISRLVHSSDCSMRPPDSTNRRFDQAIAFPCAAL